MTNKLEEVLKELQESHVLVDREEYEKLVEKAKKHEEEHLEIRVGEFYKSMGEIFKVAEIENGEVFGDSFALLGEVIWQSQFMLCSDFANTIKKATDEEIKLFKRAEMYHKHGRKLDDLRVDDFVKSGNDIYQITQTKGFVESIIDGKHELYLTLEEAQEAHKKIVGE
nr:hypothetical protein [Carnobacterium maltaromaticum]